MPGICGIISQRAEQELPGKLSDMMRRMAHHPWYVQQFYHAPLASVALGRVSLGFVNTAPQPAFNEEGRLVAVMDGELYDENRWRAQLAASGRRFQGESQAEALIHGYEQDAVEFFGRLEGKFAAAIWDSAAERLVLVNDRFGMKPVYYAHVPGKLLFASELKAVLADPDVPRKPWLRGIAQFFSYGHLLGDDTMLEDIRVLPPAAWLVYDLREDRLSVGRHWRLDRLAGRPTLTKAELFDRADAAFEKAVARRVSGPGRLGIALSGGLDGRTILAAVDHDRVPIRSVCMGVKGSLDHQSAQQLSALSNHDHHAYILGPNLLAQFERHLTNMVYLTDGHYLDQCIVVPMLSYYRELGIEILLRGHAGELMHMDKAYSFSLDRAAWKLGDEAALKQWLFGHLRAYMLSGVDAPLLKGVSRLQMESLACESLNACLKQSASVQPLLQRVWHLFVTERLRRETAMSLAMIGSMVETRIPFLDSDLLEVLLSAPPDFKVGDAIQSFILQRRKPAFLDVINSNTGARVGAGLARRRMATLRMKVLARLGVHGYQPYERLGPWLRHELRPLVRSILLSDQCLDRGVLHPDTVGKVVEQHLADKRNHTYLLMAMMIFELGQRRFVDGEPSDVTLTAGSRTSCD